MDVTEDDLRSFLASAYGMNTIRELASAVVGNGCGCGDNFLFGGDGRGSSFCIGGDWFNDRKTLEMQTGGRGIFSAGALLVTDDPLIALFS